MSEQWGSIWGNNFSFPGRKTEVGARPDLLVSSMQDYPPVGSHCPMGTQKAITCHIEVGCREFDGSLVVRLLWDFGCTGAGRPKAIRKLAEEAEKVSLWLWLWRRDMGGELIPRASVGAGRERSLSLIHHQEMY